MVRLNVQKLSEGGVFVLFDFQIASRLNGAHFLDISTSKSGPNMVCFYNFDLDMCLPPQWRALFEHLKFQKCSKNGVLLCAFNILIPKCPSRHNGLHFLNSPAKVLLGLDIGGVHFSYDQMAPHLPL